MIIGLTGLVALGTLVAVVPAARLSDRIGRKPVIYASCVLGAAGLALCAVAPSLPFAISGPLLYGLSAGIFLAVDWALMTDIIPKASSGRYMGLSNVATASSGVLAIAIGGLIIDVVGGGQGPRTALWIAVGLFALGALLLRPVVGAPARGLRGAGAERRRQPGSGGLTLARTSARAASQPASPGRRAEEVERVRAAVQPRDERPQEDEVVEADRPRPEPEQRLELDDRERQRQQAERDRDAPARPRPQRRVRGARMNQWIAGPTSSRSRAPTAGRRGAGR